jgi:hypothetical protein
MGTRRRAPLSTRQPTGKPAADLIDFYRRWPEFRETAMLLTQNSGLSAAEKETVHWLILLMDRVGDRDVGPADRS